MSSELRSEYARLQAEGQILAGKLTDLSQRATVYHHLYQQSGGNHVFPLIAAHGALWAGGYFRFGMRLGWYLSWQYGLTPSLRAERLQQLQDFADVFRDVNRRVCVDSYVNFHLTSKFGSDPALRELISPELIAVLNEVHAAAKQGMALPDERKRHIFTTHFLHEQQNVVGPALENAVANFRWPLVRWIALMPLIKFAYFEEGQRIWFSNFANRDERIRRGHEAFEMGQEVGWNRVAASLREYDILPARFFANHWAHFDEMKALAMAGG